MRLLHARRRAATLATLAALSAAAAADTSRTRRAAPAAAAAAARWLRRQVRTVWRDARGRARTGQGASTRGAAAVLGRRTRQDVSVLRRGLLLHGQGRHLFPVQAQLRQDRLGARGRAVGVRGAVAATAASAAVAAAAASEAAAPTVATASAFAAPAPVSQCAVHSGLGSSGIGLGQLP